jgi:hypothetical protein
VASSKIEEMELGLRDTVKTTCTGVDVPQAA